MIRTAAVHSPTTRDRVVRGILVGAGAGVAASIAMGAYAMLASYAKDTGLFTPLHHIASLWAAPDAMMASMQDGMAGDAFTVSAGTALLGLVIHMMTGAAYGAVFGLIAALLPFGKGVIVGLGVVWGAVVFVASAYVGLPLAAAIFDAGDPIANMAEMAGWGTFVIEHLLYGLVVGAIVAYGSVTAARARD